MARIKTLKKEQRTVRSTIRALNKQLKEDCYAGRFQLQQVGRKTYSDYNGWSESTYIDPLDHTKYGLAGHGYHRWYHADYLIRFIDNEQPERNFEKWYDAHEAQSGMFVGGESLGRDLNNFIIESDFWQKWDDIDYARTHWYSGKQLEHMMESGKHWLNVDEAKANGVPRWNREEL